MKDSQEEHELYDVDFNDETTAFVTSALLMDNSNHKQHIPSIYDFVMQMPEAIRKQASTLINDLKNFDPQFKINFKSAGEYMKTALDPKTIAINAADSLAHVKHTIEDMYTRVSSNLSDVGKNLSEKFGKFIADVSQAFSSFMSKTKEIAEPAYLKVCANFKILYEAAEKKLSPVYNNVKASLAPTVEAVSETAHKMYEKAAKAGAPIAKAASDAAGMVGEKANEAFKKATKAAQKISGRSKGD